MISDRELIASNPTAKVGRTLTMVCTAPLMEVNMDWYSTMSPGEIQPSIASTAHTIRQATLIRFATTHSADPK